MVLGRFCAGSIHALSTSRMKRLYLAASRVSYTLHSRLAKHSAMSGAATRAAGTGVRPKAVNLSVSRPDALPASTTFAASFRAGMAITHSPVARSAVKLKFASLTTHATSGGMNSTIIFHDMVITLARPFRAVVRSTTGPGSSSWYTLESGNSFIVVVLWRDTY